MKERPILFSTEMVRAILEGRKTQTRRVIKPQPNDIRESPFVKSGIETIHGYEIKPKYEPGDRLWVRETWHQHSSDDDFCTGEIHYRATEICVGTKWIPSIFMPRWASRITLEVTNVRVERVQDISEDDAIAEGIDYLFSKDDCLTTAGLIGTEPKDHGYKNYLWHGDYGRYGGGNKQSDSWSYQYSGYKNAIGSYSSLWEKTSAKRGYGWDANPWVWVIEFKRVEDCSYDLR